MSKVYEKEAESQPFEMSLQVRRILEFDRVLQLISEYAVSKTGAARVLALSPVDDAEYVEEQFELVSEMLSILTGDANFSPPETPLLTEQVLRLAKPGVVLEGKEIVSFGRLLEAAATVGHYILRREDSLPCLSVLAGQLNPFEELAQEISRIFDENSEVRSNASPVLAKLRRDSYAIRERIEKKLKEITERLKEGGSSGENFITLRQERYVIAILREEMHDCPGIIQGESGSGNTLFIEPEQVVHLNNRLREVELDIRREVYRILAGLSAQLAESREALEINIRVLAELDGVYARARYAREYGCRRPGISRDGTMFLKNARHPLLLVRVGRNREWVVPFTLQLEKAERTLLVTGPNAGGKTVLLKTVGLAVLMAQSGIFPPVDQGTRMPVFESILTAIGDEQSIDRDLSTFSGHVQDLKLALEEGTPKSLILLDEIGEGTDPAEGAALAAAVLEHLTGRNCLTLCSTHYGELKLLHEMIPGLVNGSLEFDTERMKPTFVFRKGLPGQSYGLVIARNMGLEETVLGRARNFMKGESVNIAEYLARLDDEGKRLDRKLVEVETLKAELEEKARLSDEEKSALNVRARELSAREKDFASRMEELKRSVLLESRKEVEGVIARLEREYVPGQADEAVRTARKSLEDKIQGRKTASRYPLKRRSPSHEAALPVRVGDLVSLPALDLEGEVVEGPDDSGRCVIVSGRARMTVAREDLVRLGRKKADRSKAGYDLSGVGIASGSTVPAAKLDLRGHRSDEIAMELDRFLSEAEMAGLNQVVVVHGKGTGALRARVTELLSIDRRVESFRSGAWNEGGTGATIVNLSR